MRQRDFLVVRGGGGYRYMNYVDPLPHPTTRKSHGFLVEY